jgi:hypothetical protein
MPKIPTLILVAMCIPESVDTTELTGYLSKIISGLLGSGIMVVSYCVDGSSQ